MTLQNISLSASFCSNDWEIVRKEKLHLFAEIDEQNFYLYATSDEKKVPVCFEQFAEFFSSVRSFCTFFGG